MFDLLNITLITSIVKLPLLDTGSKCHACCSNLRYTRSSWGGSLALLWVNFGLLGTNLLLLLLLSHEGIELRVYIPFFLWNYSELLLLHYLLLFFDHVLWDFLLFNKLVIFHFNNFYDWLLSHHTLNGFWNLLYHRLLLLFLRCFLLDLLLLYLNFVLPPLCGWVRQYLFNLLIMTTTLHEYFLVQCITDILNLFLMINLFTFTCDLVNLNLLPIVLITDFFL